MSTRITPDGERYIGLSFLDGRSVSEIAISLCCSRALVETVLREQFRHVIDAKKPDAPKDATPLTAGEAEKVLERVKSLTAAPETVDTQPQPSLADA